MLASRPPEKMFAGNGLATGTHLQSNGSNVTKPALDTLETNVSLTGMVIPSKLTTIID